MGTTLASALIARASDVLNDASNVTWTTAQALEWLNEAQSTIALLRPDASSEIVNRVLVAGTKQTITGRRLLSVIRNMGSDGSTPGKALTHTTRENKDLYNPDWHTDVSATVVQEYIYDSRVPDTFYVYPQVPASPSVFVELLQSIDPSDVADVEDPITLDNAYESAMVEWMLYRLFARDSEVTPNSVRSQVHYKSFFQLLGVKTQADIAVDPKNREHIR